MISQRFELDERAHIAYLSAVIGKRGTPYPCPDVSAVDRHIVRFYKQIEDTGPGPRELVQEVWADIDLSGGPVLTS